MPEEQGAQDVNPLEIKRRHAASRKTPANCGLVKWRTFQIDYATLAMDQVDCMDQVD